MSAGFPIIIDIEASGFGRGSYPIEIGLALADGRSECMIITPEPNWCHWDSRAQMLHGLTRDVLSLHGRPVLEVAQRLNTLLARRVVYSDGWGNDSSWLGLLYQATGMVPAFRVDSVRRLLSEVEVAYWHRIKREVTSSVGFPRHRASNDAWIIQETLRRVRVEASY